MSDRRSMSDEDDDRDLGAESRFGKSTVRSRYTQNKTGGEFAIEGLEERHKSKDPYYQRDEFNTFEFEMQQLAPEKIKRSTRMVESLVTGKYLKVSKDFDPYEMGKQEGVDADGDGIISTVEKIDTQMKNEQKMWVNFLNNALNFTLGLLAGISLLEFFLIGLISKKEVFLQSYTNFANISTGVSMCFINIALIFALTLSLIYGQKAGQVTLAKDSKRLEFQRLYHFMLVSTFMVSIAWVCIQILPKYSNMITFLDKISDDDYKSFRALSFVKDAALFITWMIVSFNNRSSVSDTELEPDDQVEDQDAEGPNDNSDDDNLETGLD